MMRLNISQRVVAAPPPVPWVWRTPPAWSGPALHAWPHVVAPRGLCTPPASRWKQAGQKSADQLRQHDVNENWRAAPSSAGPLTCAASGSCPGTCCRTGSRPVPAPSAPRRPGSEAVPSRGLMRECRWPWPLTFPGTNMTSAPRPPPFFHRSRPPWMALRWGTIDSNKVPT